MQIDSHVHVWQVARGDYGWMSQEDPVLYRDFGVDDLAPHLRRHGVGRAILVQAAPTEAETGFLLEAARRCDAVAGVVGWTDFAAPDAASVIAGQSRDNVLVGFRPMVQDIDDDDWLVRPDLAPAFRALIAEGLVFDALVHPRHLSRLLVVLDRHPDLATVIDHGAKPAIRDGRLDPWRADMAALAARPNAFCKLSGLVTEARAEWRAEDLRPYVDHLLATFGPQRLIWGSDWPVVNRAGGYDRWRAAALDLLAGLSDAERASVLGGAAARVYLGRA